MGARWRLEAVPGTVFDSHAAPERTGHTETDLAHRADRPHRRRATGRRVAGARGQPEGRPEPASRSSAPGGNRGRSDAAAQTLGPPLGTGADGRGLPPLHLLVLSSTLEDTTVVDLATRTVMRVRVPWPGRPRTRHQHVRRGGGGDTGRRSRKKRRPGPTRGDHGGRICPVTSARCGADVSASSCVAWWPRPTVPCSGSPARRRPTGSSGGSGLRWRSLEPTRRPPQLIEAPG